MRVPNPPANITHCIRKSVPREELRTLMIKGEADFPQPFFLHDAPQSIAVLGVEQQETAAARSNQFSAHRPVLVTDVVPPVDFLVRGPRRPFALVQPVLMHQLAEAPSIAGFERQLDAL